MSVGELACSYATMIFHDDGIPVTAEKIATLLKAANVTVEFYFPSLFAKLAEKRDITDLIMNVGAGGAAVAAPSAVGEPAAVAAAAPAAEEKKEELEESDGEGMFSLFD